MAQATVNADQPGLSALPAIALRLASSAARTAVESRRSGAPPCAAQASFGTFAGPARARSPPSSSSTTQSSPDATARTGTANHPPSSCSQHNAKRAERDPKRTTLIDQLN